MNSAFAMSQQGGYQDDEQARALLTSILNDAVDNQLLFPSARDLRGFSQHRSQQQSQFTVQTDAGSFFIKCSDLAYQPHFAAEQESLLAMMATQTISICAPLALGSIKSEGQPGTSYLILQHIPLAVHGDWFSAGQQLAQMHTHTSSRGYGFERTTWCGETAQDNRWNENWGDFFVEQRLNPLFVQLEQRGIVISQRTRALEVSRLMLSNHQPAASLLHGDLWSGNIGFNPERQLSYPVLFDPACYYGDAEADLAMTELFGRFPKKFYDGYQSISQIHSDYRERREIYQLYHVLNHALLFGGSYVQQADSLIAHL